MATKTKKTTTTSKKAPARAGRKTLKKATTTRKRTVSKARGITARRKSA
jgi:hypothetical protein